MCMKSVTSFDWNYFKCWIQNLVLQKFNTNFCYIRQLRPQLIYYLCRSYVVNNRWHSGTPFLSIFGAAFWPFRSDSGLQAIDTALNFQPDIRVLSANLSKIYFKVMSNVIIRIWGNGRRFLLFCSIEKEDVIRN